MVGATFDELYLVYGYDDGRRHTWPSIPPLRRLYPSTIMTIRTCTLALLITVLSTAEGARAQDAPAADTYDQALAYLEAGDTTAAIVWLRSVVKERRDHGPAHLRLGALLSARASEVERDFQQRAEAEKMLERAFRLMGDDPEVLLEYGLLMRKKQVRVDAKRILDRAWAAAEKRGESLTARDRARLHYELGRIYEAWWEDWQGLVMIPATAPGIACWRVPTDEYPPPRPELAVICPERWWDEYEHLPPLADLKSEERERMVAHYLMAAEADPSHVDAAVAALGHLADAEDWRRYDELAHHLVRNAPDEPRAHLFLGLGLHRRGRVGEAARAFGRALELLPSEERRAFESPERILTKDLRARYQESDSSIREAISRVVFTGKDPLFLTEGNERLMEHYSRLAWAELKFAAPASGLRGWSSDRGEIWVRYGEPERSYMCCYGDGTRTIYWSYGREGPLFTFKRQLTYRRARFTESANALADDMEATAPERYRPTTVTALHALPHQVARFRGSGERLTRVEIYAAPPADSLFAAPGARLETGIFTFLDDYTPVWNRRAGAEVTEQGVALTYRFELPPGRYRYGLEARLAGPDSIPRPAARERAPLEADGYPPGRLALSDLLLAADTVRPRLQTPTRREDLVIAPLRGTTVAAGEAIHLYFEVYGLSADSAGFGSYRAELAVEDSTERNVAERLLRAGRELLGRGAPDTRVSWERQTVVVDDLVPEYLSVEVPTLDEGDYVVRVRLTDLATGNTTERLRRLRVPAREGG